jgi:transposase
VQSAGRHFVDFAYRGSLARFAGAVSGAFDVLAKAAGLGRARHMADDLAHLSGRAQWALTDITGASLSWTAVSLREKRGSGVGKSQRGKGTKSMVVVDGQGLPLRNHLQSASPAEVKLVVATLAAIRVGRRHRAGLPRQKPVRFIADRGYDSNPSLRNQLAARGIEETAPHRKNLRKPPTQNGRAVRRYKHRWTVERAFAWLGNFRRLIVRQDRSLILCQAFFHIACLMVVLRRILKKPLNYLSMPISAPSSFELLGVHGVGDNSSFAYLSLANDCFRAVQGDEI